MTGDVFRVGADLGGHTLAFGTVRFRPGEIPELVCRCERPTPSGRDPEPVLAALAEGVREVSRGLPVVGAGLVVPGMVDRERRLFLKGPNFPGWDGLPLARNLEALLRDAGLPAAARAAFIRTPAPRSSPAGTQAVRACESSALRPS